MDIFLGLCMASATVLLFCWAYAAHRRPKPAAWTRKPGLSMLTCVALTILAPVSIGLFVRAALTPAQVVDSFGWTGAAIAVCMVALAVILSPALLRPVRQTATPVAQNRDAPPIGMDAAAMSGIAA